MTMPRPTWRIPAVLLAVQTLVLVVLAVVLLVESVAGATDSGARAATEGATVLVLAACCGLLAWGFWRERSLARTPSLLWNVLAVIVGFTVATSGAPVIGVLVIVAGVLTFVATLRVPTYDLDDGE
ncbi:hypothetical protein [Flexivirga alba]|uniref:Integral membrane protein n=1 Tax=Flexivirga alba TaxID=702742 RepID=A0ABW2ALJ3_9MICO